MKTREEAIILDGTIPDEEIKRMIAESYDLITDIWYFNGIKSKK